MDFGVLTMVFCVVKVVRSVVEGWQETMTKKDRTGWVRSFFAVVEGL